MKRNKREEGRGERRGEGEEGRGNECSGSDSEAQEPLALSQQDTGLFLGFPLEASDMGTEELLIAALQRRIEG
jgi:hypothetical protein